MGKAKNLIVKPIASTDARRIIKTLHYSGKVVNNSQVHLGVFSGDKCGGAMQFGPSLDKRKLQGLVDGTGWNEFIELNRLAFADWLPRNSESRCIGYAMRWLHKTYPWLKWVVSFADATQCGDGAIYRASGFVLTSIKVNNQIWSAPETDAREARVSLTDNKSKKQQAQATTFCRVSATKGANIVHGIAAPRGYTKLGGLNLISHSASMRPGIGAIGNAARPGGGSSMRAYVEAGFKPLPGYQLRYIYFLDPTARERLTVPIIPFSEIAARGAGMYKGQLRAQSIENDAPADQAGQGRCNSDLCAPNIITCGDE
jgi:hypothetical protein